MHIAVPPRASDKRPTVLRDNGADWSGGCPQLKMEPLSLLGVLRCYCFVFSAQELPESEAQTAFHLPRSALQLLPGPWPLAQPTQPFPTPPTLWWPLEGQEL